MCKKKRTKESDLNSKELMIIVRKQNKNEHLLIKKRNNRERQTSVK